MGAYFYFTLKKSKEHHSEADHGHLRPRLFHPPFCSVILSTQLPSLKSPMGPGLSSHHIWVPGRGQQKKKRGLKFPFTSSLKGRQVSSGSHWLELKSLHTVWDFSWTLLPFPVKTKTSRKKETVRQDEKLTSSATQCKQINIKIISARVKCSGANQTEKWKKKRVNREAEGRV